MLLIIHRHASSRSRMRGGFFKPTSYCVFMLESRMCFPRAASCKWCLASVKRATRGHARCNLGNPIPTAGGIRVILSFRTCSDKLRGPGTSSTRRCRTVCIPYEEKLSTLPLLTVTHFIDPAILQTVDIQLYGNTY